MNKPIIINAVSAENTIQTIIFINFYFLWEGFLLLDKQTKTDFNR